MFCLNLMLKFSDSSSPVKGPIISQQQMPSKTNFLWRAIAWPLALFLLSLASIYFYYLLPSDVAYRFAADGTPDAWLGRGVVLGIILGSQTLFLLLAVVVGLLMSRVLRRVDDKRAERMATILVGMPALPQTLVLFLAANMFSYNIYHTNPLPVWPITIGIIVIGTAILIILFSRSMHRA